MAYLCVENRPVNIIERSKLGLFQKKLNERGMFLAVTKTTTVFRDADFSSFCTDTSEWERYYAEVKKQFTVERLAVGSDDSILRELYALRERLFGGAPYNALWGKEPEEIPVTGLDQKDLCEGLWKKNTLLFYLSSPEEREDFRRDLKRAEREGKTSFVLVFPDDLVLPRPETIKKLADGAKYIPLEMKGQSGVCDLSSVPVDAELEKAIESGDAAFFAYGEDGLFSCRGLNLPSSVTYRPVGLLARAMTGLFTRPAKSRIYVPAGFDITPYVPMKRPSRLSYYHIAAIAEKIGEKAYSLSPEEAAKYAPDLFFRFYDDHLPPILGNGVFDGGDFYKAKEEHWQNKLRSLPGVTPLHICFDKKTFTPTKPKWGATEKHDDLLIDGVRVFPGTKVRVLTFEGKSVSPREYFFDREGNKRALVTNFTYFFTPKLVTLYNDLRKDRPKEKIGTFAGTVGYSRFKDADGRVHDTIPPYAKPCVASGKNGFKTFRFKAGSGEVRINGETFRWENENVNSGVGEVTLYTPLLSAKDESEDPRSYTLTVGDGSLNVSIVGEEILCVREGNVTLPSIGAVLSLKGMAASRLRKLLSKPDKDGYYDVSGLTPVIRMDKPEGFTQKEWDSFDWIFGGGVGLIDGDDELTDDNYMERFRRDGWLSPLSRQTQETDQHVISLQPRTAVGLTKGGELVVLVFSGRSEVSAGASYPEMCRAARILVPDIQTLISFDGGGSSVFGLVEGNVFAEISLPAPSNESVPGMGRQINSFIVVDIDG